MQVSIANTEVVITNGDTQAIFTCTHHGTCESSWCVTMSDYNFDFGRVWNKVKA